MGPKTKYEDTVYEKVVHSGKIFMYNSPSWNILFPVVDIIRILKKNTIIGFKYNKNQQHIRTYGSQYNHSVLGYELKNKNDYLNNLKAVKNIFIFSDESDVVATNLINAAKINKINIICYSNVDNLYHFYEYGSGDPISLKTPQEVIDRMYIHYDLESARKIADLFPDFEIVEHEFEKKKSTLDECIELMKEAEIATKKDKKSVKLFDPNMNKIKQMEYERSTRNTVYPDSVEILAKNEINKHRSLLSKFFTKPKL